MTVGSRGRGQPVYALSCRAMRLADEMAINQMEIPGVLLMEAAGRAVAREAAGIVPSGGRILVLAGPGNNGGDGFAAARFLHREGHDVCVLSAGDVSAYEGDAGVNARILKHLDIPFLPFRHSDGSLRTDLIHQQLKESALIIDALLGTGVQGRLRYPYRRLVDMINQAPADTLAVDIPTGVDADTAAVPGPAISADITVTFAAPKIGLLLEPGCEHTAKLIVADIGIPQRVLRSAAVGECADTGLAVVVDADWVSGRLPLRVPTGHKGTFGHVLVVGGSEGLSGAAALAASAAQRAGSGMVTCAVPAALNPVMECKLTSAMTAGFADLTADEDVERATGQLAEKIGACDAVALGPGLGRDPLSAELVRNLLGLWECGGDAPPVVVDADALNAVAPDIEEFRRAAPRAILTPHPGEMARLLGCSVRSVLADRQGAVRRAAAQSGCVVVLKGAPSVTACPCGCLWVNSSGNVGLAAGGSGDLLTGIIASLLGQGQSARDAAAVGCYVHGRAADITRMDTSTRSMIPEDVLDKISEALEELERSCRYQAAGKYRG